MSDIQSAPETQVLDEERYLPFEFRGEGFEYFRIWIVNLLLTILTLGIYSAWAKVRNNRYFYSNLYMDGQPFEYLADPLTILKGRLIAVGVLGLYLITSSFAPIISLSLMVAILILTPWLIVRSLAFNHRMSAYRNVQFRFHGTAGEAAMAIYVWPLLGAFTLGLLYPLALQKMNHFLVSNSAYGTTRFEFRATWQDYGLPLLFAILGFIGAGVVAGLITGVIGDSLPEETRGLPGLLVALPIYFLAITYMNVALFNLRYRFASLGNHSFYPDAKLGGYAWVVFTNMILIVLTLGLFLPAAKVRTTRYLTEHLEFVAVGSLDRFTAAEREQVSALGEEMGEVFDFDIGIT